MSAHVAAFAVFVVVSGLGVFVAHAHACFVLFFFCLGLVVGCLSVCLSSAVLT